MTYTQDTRSIGIETPLGKDALLLQAFAGTEAISKLFRFDLTMISKERALDLEALIGQNVTVMMKRNEEVRYFNGVLSKLWQAGSDEKFTTYQAEMVPWLWFLTRTSDCRVYQHLSVPDILQKIFGELGFQDVRNGLTRAYKPREFCVQYRETDFAFVSRLMEHEGIFYFFEHENGKHTLVLADGPTEHKECPGQAKARYQASQGAVSTDEDVVTGWSIQQSFRPAKYALTDFNFETPTVNLASEVESVMGAGVKYELYDYPGEYQTKADGEALVRQRIEVEEAQRLQVHGKSSCRSFAAGYKFTLAEHYRGDANKEYVITTIKHDMKEDSYTTGAEGQTSYSNDFTCIPSSVPFRPPLTTPKPVVQGPQTAIVVGKKGEDLWVDKFGRIKVQFHWDREGKSDESSSCWIRLAQSWAGKQWGAVFLPRLGQEVVVEFLEGNPDSPLVMGSVFNGEMGPPYELPGEQTKMSIKSSSTKDGAGANEFRFEDKKGNEQIYIHGTKDMDVVVEDSSRQRVGSHQHVVVGKNRFEEVGADAHIRVVGQEVSSVGKDATRKVGGNVVQEVGGSIVEKSGQEITLKAGMKVVVEGGMEITLKGAGGFIKIDASGVTIQGTLVRINSGGAPGTAASLSAQKVKTASGAGSSPPGGMGLLEGFDWAKLNNPQHRTTKYNFARVAMNYDLSTVHDRESSEALLASMKDDLEANGVQVLDIDGDKIKTVNNENGEEQWIDVIRGSQGDSPGFQWGVVDGPVKGGGLARHGMVPGVPAGNGKLGDMAGGFVPKLGSPAAAASSVAEAVGLPGAAASPIVGAVSQGGALPAAGATANLGGLLGGAAGAAIPGGGGSMTSAAVGGLVAGATQSLMGKVPGLGGGKKAPAGVPGAGEVAGIATSGLPGVPGSVPGVPGVPGAGAIPGVSDIAGAMSSAPGGGVPGSGGVPGAEGLGDAVGSTTGGAVPGLSGGGGPSLSSPFTGVSTPAMSSGGLESIAGGVTPDPVSGMPDPGGLASDVAGAAGGNLPSMGGRAGATIANELPGMGALSAAGAVGAIGGFAAGGKIPGQPTTAPASGSAAESVRPPAPPSVSGNVGSGLEGFDPGKLSDMSNQSPKYQFGRIAQGVDVSSVKDKASAEALLHWMRPRLEASGIPVLAVQGGRIQTLDQASGQTVWVDVIRGASSGKPVFTWLPGKA